MSIDDSLMRSNRPRSAIIQSYGKRTSALKAKKIDPEILRTLMEVLEQSRSKYAKSVKAIVIASTYFGLRPIEWSRGVSVFEEEPEFWLRVKNAKHTQGRAFGEYRHLKIMAGLDAPEFQEAYRLSSQLTGFFRNLDEQASQKWLTGARDFLNRLYRTDKRLKNIAKSKRITLYSARHQFAANAKKAGFTKAEVAAMMGHASEETATHSYGKKKSGRGGFAVAPDPDNVGAVEERTEQRHPDSGPGLAR